MDASGNGLAPFAPDGSMGFRARPRYLTVPELEQLLRVSPPADAFRAGFVLPDPDVDEILRVAKELEGAQLYADPAYPPDMMSDILLRGMRVMQVAMDVQFRENEQLITEVNKTEEEIKDIEQREQDAQAELDRIRLLLDKQQADGNAEELRRKYEASKDWQCNQAALVSGTPVAHVPPKPNPCSVLLGTAGLRNERDRDEKRLEDMEYRLKRADDALRDREDRAKDTEERLARLQEDYTDLRQTYEALRSDHAAAEAKLQIGDNTRQQDWKIERLAKENRALEVANTELRKTVQEVKTENLEVSEKIVLLDDELRKAKARELDLDARHEQLVAERGLMLTAQEELRAEVVEKMGLLDEFEARFQRQYKSVSPTAASLLACGSSAVQPGVAKVLTLLIWLCASWGSRSAVAPNPSQAKAPSLLPCDGAGCHAVAV
ncbi:uncharacterized protein HaLaN_18998, partial [Haematococcus lacustris]